MDQSVKDADGKEGDNGSAGAAYVPVCVASSLAVDKEDAMSKSQ